MKVSHLRGRHRLAAGLGVLLLATSLAGCGGDDDESSDGKPSLTLAILSTSAITATPYIAEVKGFYDDYGVDVDIMDNTGNNSLNFIASGEADLTLMASTGPITLLESGRDAVIVAASTGGAAGGFLVGGPDVTEIEDLEGGRIATLGKGTSVYGHAALYDEKFGLGVELVPMGSPAATAAAVQSGQVDGAVGPYAAFGALIDAGELNALIDSRDPAVREELIGPDFPEGALFGRRDLIEDNAEAVERTLAAMDAAQAYIDETDPTIVAQDLRELDAFKTTPEDVLAGLVENSIPHMHINDGVLDQETWELCLEQFGNWGLSDYDKDNPEYAYDKIVDMSYLEAAKELEQKG